MNPKRKRSHTMILCLLAGLLPHWHVRAEGFEVGCDLFAQERFVLDHEDVQPGQKLGWHGALMPHWRDGRYTDEA